MLIVETSIFTRQIRDELPDEEYRLLQEWLVLRPDAGKVIPGSGGLRKVRWAAPGRGKRGGLRIVYFWLPYEKRLLMLFVYRKNVRSDLTPDQLRVLREIVERELP